METTMHDSGKRSEFDTGAVRDTADGKPRLELISPYFIIGLREHNQLRAGVASDSAIPAAITARDAITRFRDTGDLDRLWDAACTLQAIIHGAGAYHEGYSETAFRRLGDWLALAARPKEQGGKGYGGRNWEKGIPTDRSMASLLRHLDAFIEERTDEPHDVAAFCNCMFILHTLEMIRRGVLPASLDTFPKYYPAEPVGAAVVPRSDCLNCDNNTATRGPCPILKSLNLPIVDICGFHHPIRTTANG